MGLALLLGIANSVHVLNSLHAPHVNSAGQFSASCKCILRINFSYTFLLQKFMFISRFVMKRREKMLKIARLKKLEQEMKVISGYLKLKCKFDFAYIYK